jgi:hypothetical protein
MCDSLSEAGENGKAGLWEGGGEMGKDVAPAGADMDAHLFSDLHLSWVIIPF